MQRHTDVQSGRRRGFTIMELLVVMGIILILATIGFTAVSTFVTSGRESATRALILKLDRVIQDRREQMELYIERADKRSGGYKPPEYMTYQPDIDRFTGAPYNPSSPFYKQPNSHMALYLARKRLFMRNFPQRFADWDFNSPGQPGFGTPDPPFNNVPSSHRPETESAEMLYYFITTGAQFGSPPIGDFEASEVADTDDDGFPEFVDAWGNPLRFYRWPTRLIRPIRTDPYPVNTAQTNVGPPNSTSPYNPINPLADPNDQYINYLIGTLQTRVYLAVDPDDEYGLNVQNFPLPPATPTLLTINPAAFELGTGSPDTPTTTYHAFHTKNTWHMPLIVSAGEDGQLGIYEPPDFAHGGHVAQPDMQKTNGVSHLERIADNISNLSMRVGGN